MTSDKQTQFKGRDSVFYHGNGPYQTKAMKKEKYADNQLRKQIHNKCMVIGCSNEYHNTINLLCEVHQIG